MRDFRRNFLRKLGVLVFFTFILYLLSRFRRKVDINTVQKKKLIVVYTPLFSSVPWWSIPYTYNFTHHDGQPCEVRNCEITYNKSFIDQSDAILFHSRDMLSLSASNMKQFREKNASQIWIWLMHENPLFTLMSLTPWDNFFNWTITYRPSSDVFMPYYDILNYRVIDNAPKPDTNFAKKKTRQCIAMISNCNQYRVELIRNLKKYIGVHVFGKCKDIVNPELKLDCPKKSESCRKLQQEYKFYLAFENSFCEDYVTEKYYMHGLKQNLIPVVLSGADFNNRKVALSNSYINLLDFKDMKSLADYLNYLDKNDTAYNEYHQWRYSHRINNSVNFMCGVCKSLWQVENQPKTVKLTEFWSAKSCRSYNEEMFQKYLR